MRTALFMFTLALFIPAPCTAGDKDGFNPLFNGKDLAGWTPIAKKDKDGPLHAPEADESEPPKSDPDGADERPKKPELPAKVGVTDIVIRQSTPS